MAFQYLSHDPVPIILLTDFIYCCITAAVGSNELAKERNQETNTEVCYNLDTTNTLLCLISDN
jgi:hypothetical protein